MGAPQFTIETFSNTHVKVNGARMPKNLISAKVFNDTTVILKRGDQKIWDNVTCSDILNVDTGENFADGHVLDAFLNNVLRDPSAELTARIVVAADGNTITHPVLGGDLTLVGIVIAGATKVEGFSVDKPTETLTFTDDTTVTTGQILLFIFTV